MKFWIYKVEGMYYLCSENKGADQLRGYREADLRLCFRICKKPVFSQRGSNEPCCMKTCSMGLQPGFEVIKLFSFSNQLSMIFIQLINVKMPTIIGILTFINRINNFNLKIP